MGSKISCIVEVLAFKKLITDTARNMSGQANSRAGHTMHTLSDMSHCFGGGLVITMSNDIVSVKVFKKWPLPSHFETEVD